MKQLMKILFVSIFVVACSDDKVEKQTETPEKAKTSISNTEKPPSETVEEKTTSNPTPKKETTEPTSQQKPSIIPQPPTETGKKEETSPNNGNGAEVKLTKDDIEAMDLVNDEIFQDRCNKFIKEDKVPETEVKEYLEACVDDLKQQAMVIIEGEDEALVEIEGVEEEAVQIEGTEVEDTQATVSKTEVDNPIKAEPATIETTPKATK